MTQLEYRPADFKVPVIRRKTYSGVFNEPEWDRCAEYIVRQSIFAGYWKPVKVLATEKDLSLMIVAGFLENTKDGFILTSEALERIIERFPAEF